jgi:NAD(P)-dependent dehydrogenase (short-subunit alcohol dehydrogenase family)
VTGRTTHSSEDRESTIYTAAQAVTAAGGEGIAVRVDHGDDNSVAALFRQVAEENGELHLLVNNAAFIHDQLTNPAPFWEKPIELADVLTVGLRSAYVASWHAAPLLIASGRGLIAFTSSPGSVCYMHGAAYGAQKAGVDKLAADMAVDFRGSGVQTVSVWMGILLTERLRRAFRGKPDAYAATAAHAETPQFTGRVINALYDDAELANFNGRTVISAEIAQRYGILDEDGRTPPSHREMLGSPREPHPAVIR